MNDLCLAKAAVGDVDICCDLTPHESGYHYDRLLDVAWKKRSE